MTDVSFSTQSGNLNLSDSGTYMWQLQVTAPTRDMIGFSVYCKCQVTLKEES